MQGNAVNRKYKDRLFRRIFDGSENRENLLSLYNAVNGTNYSNSYQLEITTIDDVIYLGMKNDVSFIIDYTMNLYEHQSTFCPNMPLRGLFYASKLYEQFVARYGMKLYSRSKLRIPAPRYVVFFNGSDQFGDSMKLRLSDMFIPVKQTAPDRWSEEFEWTATMLNINLGHNKELMDKCRPLMEYATYVDKLTNYRKDFPIAEAAAKTVEECIQEGILSEFLTKHRSEVMDLILTEYDEDEVRQVYYEDGLEEGLKKGMEDGLEKGMQDGLEKGMQDGLEKGMQQKALEAARRLKRAGVSEDIIAESVGLPRDLIQMLE